MSQDTSTTPTVNGLGSIAFGRPGWTVRRTACNDVDAFQKLSMFANLGWDLFQKFRLLISGNPQ